MERLVVVLNAFYAIERKVVQFIMPVGGCTPGLEESKRIIRYTSRGKRGVTCTEQIRPQLLQNQLQKRFHALHHLILVVPSQDRSDPQCNCIIWTLRCKEHFKAFTGKD